MTLRFDCGQDSNPDRIGILSHSRNHHAEIRRRLSWPLKTEDDPRRFLHPDTIARAIARLDLRARQVVEGFISGMHRSPFFRPFGRVYPAPRLHRGDEHSPPRLGKSGPRPTSSTSSSSRKKKRTCAATWSWTVSKLDALRQDGQGTAQQVQFTPAPSPPA